MLVIKKSLILILLVCICTKVYTQEKKLSATLSITSKDQKQSLTLYQELEEGKPLEGYFAVPSFTKAIYGQFKDGGFNFLDPKVWGDFTRTLVKKWVQNKFPITDIETMTNGFDMSKALSFFIDIVRDKKDKSVIGLAPKFALFSSKEKKSKREYDLNFDVDLHYKLLYTTIGKVNNWDFFSSQLPEFNINFTINEVASKEKVLSVNSSIYNEIKKSLEEQFIDSTSFDFNIDHGVYPPKEMPFFRDVNFLSSHKQSGFEKKYKIADIKGMDTLKLSLPVYYAKLVFPFVFYNEEKFKSYSEYKSKEDVLRSTYEFIIVPISIEDKFIIVDLFSIYNKLNLTDDIPRWSPSKKRLTLNLEYGESLELPKENWSVVFKRGNDNYEIYGYSDYERYVSEYLNLSCIKMIKEN